jgi:[protein-PII] uridylyltransferase
MSVVQENVPLEIIHLIDEQRLENQFKSHPDNLLPSLKEAISTINDGLKNFYSGGSQVEDIVYGRANLIDRVLITVFNHLFSNISQSVSLLSVGGYGRGELHPGSDIDLLILLKEAENNQTKEALEKLVMLLWDSKLEIGHSVRTVEECVAEAEKDITVTTNIMESRLVAGDATLFEEMKSQTEPDKIWNNQAYFQAKLDEQLQRSGKYNDTAYGLEPNIKESRGGLRDIQMIGWVAKRHFGATCMQDLIDNKFLQQEELDTLLKGQHLLWRIRCSLHYLAGRREDRLLFDYQGDLAREFGYKEIANDKTNHTIEQFMQRYYRTVMELEQLNEMLLQLFRQAILYKNEEGEVNVINDAFQVRHGYIEARHKRVFIDDPSSLLDIFYVMQNHPEIQGVRAETIRLIREHRYLIDDDFRNSTKAKELFIKIINHPRGVTHELRRMNRYGIIAAYIPAFDSIVGRMQYDLFHAYTVDQHTLFVIRNMRRLSVPEFCHELPLASGVFHHLKKPELLYLAGLFHDIAKGRQGDHATLGAVDALEFCIKHDLNTNDAELVSWLVRNHLTMSMTAQRKDISDPDVIREFAESVRTLANLDYLYLLTISDIRGTNPELWNSWKDKLLVELYNKSAALLQKGLETQTDKYENIQQNKTDALRILELKGISSPHVHEIWDNLTDQYFLQHTPGEIVWHTRYIFDNTDNIDPIIKTRIDSQSDSLDLFVYTKSKDHIFANIVSVIGQLSLNVVSAQIVNCKNGFALETFKILSDNYTIDALEHAAIEMAHKLDEKLTVYSDHLSEFVLSTPRRHKYFDIPTLVKIESTNDRNIIRIHIEANDRPGLLAVVAKTFIDCNVRILSAKISTAGEKALDYFDITSKDSDKPLTDDQQKSLEAALIKNI